MLVRGVVTDGTGPRSALECAGRADLGTRGRISERDVLKKKNHSLVSTRSTTVRGSVSQRDAGRSESPRLTVLASSDGPMGSLSVSSSVRGSVGMRDTNCVVVGAGQAGLAVSYLLTEAKVPHVVVERGRVGESWRSQRWDSFSLNTPNWSNRLPGMGIDDDDSDGFAPRDEVVSFLERYAASFGAPVLEGTAVISVQYQEKGAFVVDTTDGR